MIRNKFLGALACIFLMSLFSAPLFGQAVLSVGSTPATGSDIGVTELTGSISLTVTSGTTIEAPLMIQYSAPITNNEVGQEVQITKVGSFDADSSAPVFDPGDNVITIIVPGGGIVGDRILIRGVRVALAGEDPPEVTASITGPAGGNLIAGGQNNVTVINRIRPVFSIDMSQSPLLTYEFGKAKVPSTFIDIAEGWAGAFTDDVGTYGQTTPTEFTIDPFPSIPPGVKITFSQSTVSKATGAVLQTLSGEPEEVPREDGSTSVTYEFKHGENSAAALESFRISISMKVDPEVSTGSGSITFQTTLKPYGLAVPDKDYPSTEIPRYWKTTLPDESDLVTGFTELFFPFRAQKEDIYTGMAITNPLDYRVKTTMTAYDTEGNVIEGPGITNPVSLIIGRRSQLVQLATDLFGADFNQATAGTIRVTGQTPNLLGFYLQGDNSGPRMDGAISDPTPLASWVCPILFKQEPSPDTVFELFNPGEEEANPVLKLFDADGNLIAASDAIPVAAGGTRNLNVGELFPGVDPDSFPGGFVKGRSDVPLIVRETFGNALDSNVLPVQRPIQQKTFYVAHFATGGGYTSELSLVNGDNSMTADITLTLLREDGEPFAFAGNPLQFSLAPGKQLIRTVGILFPELGDTLSTGSIRIDVKGSHVGPFVSQPAIAGALRFSAADGSGSATLPLYLSPARDFAYSHIAANAGYYTGVALMNTNTEDATVSVVVFDEDGSSVGEPYTVLLHPRQKFAKLIDELVPEAAGRTSGYIRIHATLPVTSFSLFGTNDGLSLSAIAPQVIGN